jgi:hypothetical protein
MATTGRWKSIFIEGFEGGFGKFKDGGTDATIFTRLGYGRTKQSLMLQDNVKSSRAVLRDAVDIASYSELKLSFYFRTYCVRKGEKFLVDYSINGGKWKRWKAFQKGDSFNRNGKWYEGKASLRLDPSMETIKFRFRTRFATNE